VQPAADAARPETFHADARVADRSRLTAKLSDFSR
jgi:hypothetical protein